MRFSPCLVLALVTLPWGSACSSSRAEPDAGVDQGADLPIQDMQQELGVDMQQTDSSLDSSLAFSLTQYWPATGEQGTDPMIMPVQLVFSEPIDAATVPTNVMVTSGFNAVPVSFRFVDSDRVVLIDLGSPLGQSVDIWVGEVRSLDGDVLANPTQIAFAIRPWARFLAGTVETPSQDTASRIAMAVDASERVYVAWVADAGPQAGRLRVSQHDGLRLAPVGNVLNVSSTTPAGVFDVDVSPVDGTPWVAWSEGAALYVARYEGASGWVRVGNTFAVDFDSDGPALDLEVDLAGVPLVSYVGTDPQGDVVHTFRKTAGPWVQLGAGERPGTLTPAQVTAVSLALANDGRVLVGFDQEACCLGVVPAQAHLREWVGSQLWNVLTVPNEMYTVVIPAKSIRARYVGGTAPFAVVTGWTGGISSSSRACVWTATWDSAGTGTTRAGECELGPASPILIYSDPVGMDVSSDGRLAFAFGPQAITSAWFPSYDIWPADGAVTGRVRLFADSMPPGTYRAIALTTRFAYVASETPSGDLALFRRVIVGP